MALRQLFSEAGISHFTSPPHTPEHNGISERKHRHVVETGLSLLTQAGMPNSYWTYAFATAVYLINRLSKPVIDMKSPLQKLFGDQPNYSKLRVFGCLCFPWLRPYTSHKLENRSTPCVFLGYSLTQSAYLCLQPSSGRIYTSRHVKFDETSFPFVPLSQKSIDIETHSISLSPPLLPDRLPLPAPLVPPPPQPSSPAPGPTSSDTNLSVLQEIDEDDASPSRTREPLPTSPHQLNPNRPITSSYQAQVNQSPTTSPNPPPGPTPNSLSQNETQQQRPTPPNNPTPSSPPEADSPPQPNLHPMQTRRKNNIVKPKSKFNLSAALSTNILPEPLTVNQALKDKRCR